MNFSGLMKKISNFKFYLLVFNGLKVSNHFNQLKTEVLF
jgi:hypothetical protein